MPPAAKLAAMRNDTELFNKTVTWLIDTLEGGDSNHPSDRGGLTRFGISKAAFPTVDIFGLTRANAIALYRQHYWDANWCGGLPPALAVAVFDGAVQHRHGVAAKLLQQCLGVTADGTIGPATIAFAQGCNVSEILIRYMARRAELYSAIVTANSSQAVFLKGWFTRLFRVHQFAIQLTGNTP